ncbi:MAG: hypothetical protein ABI910_05460 [Gemmatimonadota bacterium]
MRSRHVAPAALLVAMLLTACDGPGVASPGAVRFGQVGSNDLSQAIVGTWRRSVFFLDDFGIARSSETSWQFGSDGAVVRILLARNLTYGLADVQVITGRYRIENTRLLVDVLTPSPTQLSYEVRRSSNQLTIAGEPYVLAAP